MYIVLEIDKPDVHSLLKFKLNVKINELTNSMLNAILTIKSNFWNRQLMFFEQINLSGAKGYF